VGAVGGFASRTAPCDRAGRGDDSGVHGSERRGGEGGEHTRVDGDGFGDAFAAGQAGADELVGVGTVGFGARRADRGAPVSAGQVDDLVRCVIGVQGADDLAGCGVDVADPAAQPDRADAAAGGEGGAEPVVVVVAGCALEKFVVECPGARPVPRSAVGEDGEQGQRRGSHARLAAGRELFNGTRDWDGDRPIPAAATRQGSGSGPSCCLSVVSRTA
jgi:hypothetical protein